jgi:hypothetical protein
MDTCKKTCFIALLTCFIGWNGFAQTTGNRGYIGYSVGPSFHVGNQGYISPDNESEQFAKSGYYINYVNFGLPVRNKRNLGITGSIIYGETIVANSNEDVWWVVMGITAGPMFSFALTDKLYLNLRPEFGRVGTINYSNQKENSYAYFGGGWAVDYCTTIRYNIYKRLCLMLETGYMSTNQRFPDERKVRIQEIYTGVGVVFLLKSRDDKLMNTNR